MSTEKAASHLKTILVHKTEKSVPSRKLKSFVLGLFGLVVLPRHLAYRIAQVVLGKDRAFSTASESIARIPGTRGVYARQAFYRRTLRTSGKDVYFGWLSVFSSPQASVGDRVFIGRRCNLGCVDIGSQALLSDGVQVLSGAQQHGIGSESSYQDQGQSYAVVKIGANVWIGANAVVMADVGEGAIVGAGAVVTRPIPKRTVATGVPARVRRELD